MTRPDRRWRRVVPLDLVTAIHLRSGARVQVHGMEHAPPSTSSGAPIESDKPTGVYKARLAVDTYDESPVIFVPEEEIVAVEM